MKSYKEVTQTIEVPKNVGLEGFLHTIREVLKLNPQEITIDNKGRLSYKRFVLEGEPAMPPLGIEYEGLEPHSIIRLGSVSEIRGGADPHILLANMFDQIAVERLVPICWAFGAMTYFWSWYESHSGIQWRTHENLYGLPIYYDRALRDTSIYLCAAYNKEAALIDCHRFLALDVEVLGLAPQTTVDIL